METPATSRPQVATPSEHDNAPIAPEPGASNATLTIFLAGVMLLLLICVGFVLAAN